MEQAFDLKGIEKKTLKYWKDKKIFEKCKEKSAKGERFRFIDGPPYTTGSIHLGTAWNKVLKDSILRYKRMQGYNVRSQPGYDMHGLPIEVKVEENLGIRDKKEIIEKIGMDKFIQHCREFALKNLGLMNEQFASLGVWMDWEKPYRTIDNSYIEGAWWALKKAHEKNLLYIGPKSVTWCWRCATALAKHELEYKTVEEPSIYVKFPLVGKKDEYILVWTTTPWTIPFNMSVAVHPDIDYSKVKVGDTGETWIFARNMVPALSGVFGKKLEILETFKGSELDGLNYKHPFFEEMPKQQEFAKDKKQHRIIAVGDDLFYGFVGLGAGCGCVHTAPGCGAEDFEVGRKLGIFPFNTTDENGIFGEDSGKFKGWHAKHDNKKFIEALKEKGLLIEQVPVDHEYPHCWRCKSPVIFRATDQWYLKTSSLKEEMIADNKKVKWSPDWAGERWFRDWLENLQDWCISRQRFWGIPLPIWKCECGEMKVIGSRSELPEKMDDLHRPWIDEVKFKCEKCGGEMTRVPDILDVWLDSGASTWATLPFPEQPEELDKWFPCDFITEGKDQIRGWFNSLLALSMVSHGVAPYKSVYMHGFVTDEKGMKMSKSVGNIVTPEEVIEKHSIESWRLYCIGAANPGEDLKFNWKDLAETYRSLNILWNTFQFASYMDVEGFNPEEYKLDNSKLKPEDKWILSKVNTLNQKVTDSFENMEYQDVPVLLKSFVVEDLSRWYVKLIRSRTWVSVKGDDKLVAFKVLYEVLKKLLVLSAPIIPFITEELYQGFLRDKLKKAPESVHLLDWPEPDNKLISPEIEQEMDIVSGIVEAARFAREEAKIKQRWPVKAIAVEGDNIKKAVEQFNDVLVEQTNAKKVVVGKTKGVEADFEFGKVYVDTEQDDEIIAEALSREVMRAVQVLRKQNKFKVEEKISLNLKGDDFANNALGKFRREISKKVGAAELNIGSAAKEGKIKGECKFKERSIDISLEKLGP